MESLVCNDHVYDLCSINGFYCAVTDFDKLFKNSDHSAENAEATETHLVENAEVNDNINNFMQGPVSRINITSPYDPWTKDLIKNPVCNKVCGHVYDLDSISSRINDKNKIRCAVTDCHNLLFISSDHLVENAGVKEKIQELIQDDEYPF
ncbi:uncharacterized protein LOC108118416 [Drosophila eugracilis]|uniref:uncharacterized protein LOC108118416 n=1 Tax=Drosophila eugracilis TaxID=29029 RepID=UPI0007E73BAB|nr:uncharacterized protein LOC108118416 [Drosophila eugracilis]